MQNFLFIRDDETHTKLDFSDIIYIKAVKNYLKIITKDQKHQVKYTIEELEAIFPSDQFLRIHRSFIISVESITGIASEFVFLKNTIPIGREYKKNLQEIFIMDGGYKTNISQIKIDKIKQIMPPNNN